MRFAWDLAKTDDLARKDPLLEALEKTLEESRRLRSELHGDGPAPSPAASRPLGFFAADLIG
jgi:hypothetical protein